MFRGVNKVNIDAKGRMAVPAKYREQLLDESDGRLIATIDISSSVDRCLMVYPEARWEEVERKFMALPALNPAVKTMQRLLLGFASDCQLDGQGRILLSAALREYAGIEKKVVVVGLGFKFEVWKEETWTGKQDQWLDEVSSTLEQLPDELKALAF